MTRSLLILVVAFCGLTAIKAQQNNRDRFLVDRIYNYHGDLLAEYFYDDDNRLIKKVRNDTIVESWRTLFLHHTDEFVYENGRVSKMISTRRLYEDRGHIHYDFIRETTFEYDSQGRLIKRNGEYLNFRFDEKGRVVGIPLAGLSMIADTLVYDNSNNIIKHIIITPKQNMLGQPIPGTSQRSVNYFQFDNNPKPNFGIDHLFVFQPLPIPSMGNWTSNIMNLSRNNMIKDENMNIIWTYTYNEYGLPATIRFNWFPVDIFMRITYRKIGETSVPELTQEFPQINIYPNPTQGIFWIDCENVSAIIIYDMLGNEILRQTVSRNSEINISHLPQGIYNVRFLSGNKIIGNSRIVKQ